MYINLNKLIEGLEPKPIKSVNPILAIFKHDENIDSEMYIKNILSKAKRLEAKIIIQDLKNIECPGEKVIEVQKLSNAVIPINPLPKDIKRVVHFWIDKEKDIDNFTGKSIFENCTAEAVLKTLKFLNITTDKHVLVVGRHIGLEIFNILLKNDFTVTIAHSKTKNLELLTKYADVVVSATGVKNLITKDMVKINSLVIDVGLGDVAEEVIEKADVTPIRNGVGAVVTATLFKNLFETVRRE